MSRFIGVVLVLLLAASSAAPAQACDPKKPQYLSFQRLAVYYSKTEKKYFLALLATDAATRGGKFDKAGVDVVIEKKDGSKIDIMNQDLVFVHLGSMYNQMAAKYTFFRFNLVLDFSASITDENLVLIQDVTSRFVKNLPRSFDAQVILFSDDVSKSPFMKDQADVQQAIHGQVERGMTALHDAIATAVEELKFSGDDVPLKFSVILTDGMDTASTRYPDAQTFRDYIVSQTQQYGIPLFIIGVGDEVDDNLLRSVSQFGLYQPIQNFPDVDVAFNALHEILDNTYIMKIPAVSSLDELRAFYLVRRDPLTKKPVTMQDICLQ